MSIHGFCQILIRSLGLIFLCGAIGFAVPNGAGPAKAPKVPPATPQTASFDILVVAPHSDDEAIGCTGVMVKALKARKSVGVVVVTNGDGFPEAAAAVSKKPLDQLVPGDFFKLTAVRQQHSIDALAQLGVPAANLIYLGYPDGGLQQMYEASGDEPFQQKFTKKSETYGVVLQDYHSLFHGTPAPYLKASVVGDLAEIIKARRPQEIYVTNEIDVHPDHKTSFWLVRDAARAAGWHGTIYTFVAHGAPPATPPGKRLVLGPELFRKKHATIELYQKHTSPVHDTLADEYTKPEEDFWPVRIK